MRLTGGSARGKVLLTPRGKNTRPTDARTREMVFNMLATDIADARILDIYAGSGAIGLEALSRGAASCAFVEQNKNAAGIIRQNLKNCGWEKEGIVWPCAATIALHKMLTQDYKFDIIFIDPPFNVAREWINLTETIDKAAQLLHNVREAATIIVQHPRRQVIENPSAVELVEMRRAGESSLSFFKK